MTIVTKMIQKSNAMNYNPKDELFKYNSKLDAVKMTLNNNSVT